LLLVTLRSTSLIAQTTPGIYQWRAYTSFKNAIQTCGKGDDFYTITKGGLLAFNKSSRETKFFSTVEGLSSVNPSTIHYNPTGNIIVIGYNEGFLDYFDSPSSISTITDIARTTTFSDKKINKIVSYGSYIYIATNFGIVVYDLIKKETKFTYSNIGSNDNGVPVTSLEIHNDSIYACTPDGLFTASLNFPNLADSQAWTVLSGNSGLPSGTTKFVTHAGNYLYTTIKDSLFRFNGNNWTKFNYQDTIPVANYNMVSSTGGRLEVSFYGMSVVLSSNGSLSRYYSTNPNSIFSVDAAGYVLSNDAFEGLIEFTSSGQSYLTPLSPTNNFCTKVATANNELYIAPKGVGVGYSVDYDYSGVYYHNDNDGWKILNNVNNTLPSNGQNSYTFAHFNATTGSCFLSSFGNGLTEMQNGSVTNFWNGTNSGLTGVYKDSSGIETDIRITGIDFDKDGQVWTTAIFASKPLAVKTSGGWYSFTFPSVGNSFTGITIDDLGYKWITLRNNGIMVFNDAGTPASTSDDQYVLLNSSAGTGSLANNDVKKIIKDKNGYIWCATAAGVTVFYDPSRVFGSGAVDGQCPVIQGRCLLKDENVTSIATDGANRKWLGTANGVYLVNEDATEQIHYFSKDNSPLLSNNILDIAVDNKTGEVFFATDQGVISYRSDATEPLKTCKNPEVFPNPVEGNYDGPIGINGLPENTIVKITTVTGALVRELNSIGGQAVWDGRDVRGNKVSTGVYLVFSSDDKGEKSCFTKIAIVNP